MENDKNWQYNTSLTIRLDRKLKNRILREAESRDMSVSEYFRTFFESAELSDTFLIDFPENYKAFLKRHIAEAESRTGKSRYEIASRVISQCVEYAMDNGFLTGKRR